MAVRASAQKLLAWGKEHGSFFLGCVALGITSLGGAATLARNSNELKKDLELRKEELEHERELRKEVERRLEQRTDLVVKNQLFDILHHADYEAAARLLHGSQASSAVRPSTD